MRFGWRMLLVWTVCTGGLGCAHVAAHKPKWWGGSAASSKPSPTVPVAQAQAPQPAVSETPGEAVSPHDSATQLLIASELKDATPEERERWIKRLNTLPSSQVAMALRERRSGVIPAEATATPNPTGSGTSPIQQASGDTEANWNALDFNRFKGRLGLPQILPDKSIPESTVPQSLPDEVPLQADTQPISPGQALWETEIGKLQTLLESEVTGNTPQDPGYTRKQVALRMLALLSHDPQAAARVIPQLPPAEQEFWSSIFQGLAHCLEQTSDDEAARAQALGDLRSAIHHLQSISPLELANVSFCRRIDGFGDTERFPQEHFTPGESVLIYAELRNFHSEPLPAGGYESRIRSSAELVRLGEEAVVDQKDFGATLDHCQVIRHDYFLSFRIDLPQVTPGEYQLRLKVQDEQSGKIATAILPLSLR